MQHWVILLVKLAVAASLASYPHPLRRFQRMLMREERTLAQRVQMALVCAVIFGAGVATRIVTNSYQAVDLGLEGSLVMGMLGGYVTGLLAGVLISVPAMFARRADDHAAAGRRRRHGRPAAGSGSRQGIHLALHACSRTWRCSAAAQRRSAPARLQHRLRGA